MGDVRNIEDFLDGIRDGKIGIDPVDVLRRAFAKASGEPELTDKSLEEGYAALLDKEIRGKLDVMRIKDFSAKDLYNVLVESGKPVKISVLRDGEESQWVALPMDCPGMLDAACFDADEAEKAEISGNIRKSVKTGEAFDYETENLKVSGEIVQPGPIGRMGSFIKEKLGKTCMNLVLTAMVFSAFAGPFADNAAHAAENLSSETAIVQMDKKLQKRDILHTIGLFKSHRDDSFLKVFDPQIQDKYIASDEIQSKVKAMEGKSLMEKINFVNDLVNNNFDYTTDMENYGKSDLWALPQQFKEKGGGDCEDFAIAKYKILEAMGVPAQSMMMLVGFNANNEAHAILAVYDDARQEYLFLDNAKRKVQTEKSMEGEFFPKESINSVKAVSQACKMAYSETARKKFPVAYGMAQKKQAAQKAGAKPASGKRSRESVRAQLAASAQLNTGLRAPIMSQ